ncbi:MAG: AAA family ATPase, partial [Gammaproteobacteria bacterium]
MTAHITTFYSYKGGVGRTLLLANVGMSLAQAGRRVLLWDLDVEAPGMHLIPALSPHPIPARGFLEWLDDWQRQGMARPTPRQLKALNGCVCEVPETEARLHILPAFGEKADFAALYQAIDWAAFLA